MAEEQENTIGAPVGRVLTSFQTDIDTLYRIEQLVKARAYKSRSDFIRHAVEMLIEEEERHGVQP